MDPVTLGAAGLVVLAGAAWFYSSSTDPTSVKIQTGTQSGSVPFTSNASLPKSFNQAEGATFSFDGWFVVQDFTTIGYGQKRMIFSRADCPGLYIDSTSNSLIVTVDTFGATETVMIGSIPTQKWLHFAIVVTQYSVDVYIAGILRQHHTLTQLPKQTDAPIQIASTGFDGQVGGLTYYSRALSAEEVASNASESPPQSLVTEPASGWRPDITWYTGR